MACLTELSALVSRIGRALALSALLSLTLNSAAATAAAPKFEHYDGVDPARIPSTLRPFFINPGLNVLGIITHDNLFSYRLESDFYKTPWPKWPRGKDFTRVYIVFHATSAEADRAFADEVKNAERQCTEGTSQVGRCVRESLGSDMYGATAIYDESVLETEHPPDVSNNYAIRLRGSANAVAMVYGYSSRDLTTVETPTRAIAMSLAKAVGGPVEAAAAGRPLPPLSSLMTRVQATATEAWRQVPPLEEVKIDYAARPPGGGYMVYSQATGKLDCLPKAPSLPGPAQRPAGGDFRLLRARELMQAALLAMGLSEADIAALREGVTPPAATIPAAVRERAYILWGPGRIKHYLYDSQLVLSPAEGSAGLQKIDWELPAEPCPSFSSEHSSVRGTINGGGDFIRYQPAPSDRRGSPFLIRTAWPILAAAAAGTETIVELPGAVVTLSPDAVAAIDLAPGGVTAVALLAGSAAVVERSGGARRTLGPDQLAVSVPTLGVSPAVPLDTQSRDALRLIARAPAPYPAAAAAATASAGELTEIRTARQIAWGEPVGVADSFTPDVNPIFVWFRHRGLAAGAKIEAIWTYLETAQPREIGRGEVSVTAPSDWGQFSYELEAGKAWPTGRYQVRLSIDGRPAGGALFRVLAAGSAPALPPDVYRDAAGYELTVPPGWTRAAGTQGFSLVNATAQIAVQTTVQHSPAPISNEELFAVVRDAFRSDADYELVRAEPKRLTSAGRDGYLLVLRSKADRHALVVVLAARSPGPTSSDHYILKALSTGEDSVAALAALEQVLAGFRIVD